MWMHSTTGKIRVIPMYGRHLQQKDSDILICSLKRVTMYCSEAWNWVILSTKNCLKDCQSQDSEFSYKHRTLRFGPNTMVIRLSAPVLPRAVMSTILDMFRVHSPHGLTHCPEYILLV